MKRILAALMTGYRPKSSERGAIRNGPPASPSSQIVTRRTLEDLLGWPSDRSSTILLATGTTDIHVNVLHEESSQSREATKEKRVCKVGEHKHCKCHKGEKGHNAPFVSLGPVFWVLGVAIGIKGDNVFVEVAWNGFGWIVGEERLSFVHGYFSPVPGVML